AATRASGRTPGPSLVTPWWFSNPVRRQAERGVHIRQDLAYRPAVAAPAAQIGDLQAGYRLALLSRELRADQLIARAHGENDRAEASRGGQAAVGTQPAG